MNRLRSNLYSYLTKTIVLFFYVCFFIAQLSFNVGARNSSSSISPFSFHKNIAGITGHHFHVVKKVDKEKSKRQTIHLNKRFEPIDLLVCNLFLVKPLICRLSAEPFRPCFSIFIPALFLHLQSFRGPPFVA